MPSSISLARERICRVIVESGLVPEATAQSLPSADLWSLGMNSLGSVRLIMLLEDEFGVRLPDELLSRESISTVDGIAATLGAAGAC
jgi:acyl carrier protein